MIPFTKYRRPNGTKIQQNFDPQDEEIEKMGQELVDAGCVFEAELLSPVAEVFLECINHNVDEDSGLFSLASELSPNGPGIEDHIRSLVRRAHERMFK